MSFLSTSLPSRAVARILASIVRRVLAGSSSGSAFAVLFGEAASVCIGSACLCTLSDADGGVSIDWAPGSAEVRALLSPLLGAALDA